MAYRFEFSLAPFIPGIDFVGGFPAYNEKYPLASVVYQYDPADIPSEAVVRSSHKIIPHFVPIHGMLSVCPEVREVIEEIEPGVHEFFPVHIRPKTPSKVLLRRDKRPLAGPYYLLNIQTALDAVCVERSEVDVEHTTSGLTFVRRRGRRGKVVLYKDKVSGHHLWRGDTHLMLDRFFSDVFTKQIEVGRFNGLEFEHIEEV